MKTSSYNPDVLNCIANLSNDEVFTPPELANKMLDLLPQDLFCNPKTTFLDPFTKSGVFLREIVKRLDRGLESQIPDRQKRIDHILHNQVFGIACTELTSLLARRSVYCSKKANSQYSVSKFDDEEGNILYKNLKHTWVNGKCKYCGASQSVYDRGSEAEQYAYMFIHTDNPKKFFNMHFDVIVGNPPYQLSDGGNAASAKPIYHLFVQQAIKLLPKFLCMIIPSRWFAGGKGLDDFRRNMLNDQHISKMIAYEDARDCFPSNIIGGGICFFLWNKDYSGLCDYTHVFKGEKSNQLRDISEFPIFIRYNQAINIIHKVSWERKYLSTLVSSRNPFSLPTSERGEEIMKGNSCILYTSQGKCYYSRNKILQGLEDIDCYKIMVGRAISGHAGETDSEGQVKVFSTLNAIGPNEICTDTYIIIGRYKEKGKIDNMLSYLKTKFVRFLVLQTITSINITRTNYQFVPLQDFSHPWTDEMLYKKYGLTEDEIAFIESMIRPME
ncbi:MAG: Eco57I restriction-modification methylase domain-containing protein [Bacteroidaceae bacterium]|nr:Eco57I restriction-modification methylase domain-containing protein [Bacteroidaceae bacterium]